MSKAILVIDTPNNCEECELKYLDTGDDAYFGPNVFRCVVDGSEICKDDRHYDCPLKNLPEKKKLDSDLFLTNNFRLQYARFKGYNECLDKILGEEE